MFREDSKNKKTVAENFATVFFFIGVTGFEPATSASRTQRSTKLSHTPIFILHLFKTQALLYLKGF